MEIVRRLFHAYLEALDRGDLDIWFNSDDLAEDFEWVMPREGGHAVGSLAPIVEGYIGCIVIRTDRSRVLARAMPDPLAQQRPD